MGSCLCFLFVGAIKEWLDFQSTPRRGRLVSCHLLLDTGCTVLVPESTILRCLRIIDRLLMLDHLVTWMRSNICQCCKATARTYADHPMYADLLSGVVCIASTAEPATALQISAC